MSLPVNVLVLMYHAVPTSMARCVAADPHYAVERLNFINQMALIKQRGLAPASVRDLLSEGAPACEPESSAPSARIAVTFDDGHESNFAAFAEILRIGGSADFFVNPSTVGTAGHLSWAQLREMDRQGASIQSHGMHHVGLDDLPSQGVDEELSDSRKRIEDELSRPVELFAPPFGRMAPGLAQRARGLGYQALCTSRVGLWRDADAVEIPRFAVRATTSHASLAAWIERSPMMLGAARARALAVGAGKQVLGRSAFIKLRRLWMAAR